MVEPIGGGAFRYAPGKRWAVVLMGWGERRGGSPMGLRLTTVVNIYKISEAIWNKMGVFVKIN